MSANRSDALTETALLSAYRGSGPLGFLGLPRERPTASTTQGDLSPDTRRASDAPGGRRAEPCACTGWIVADPLSHESAVREAMRAHQATPLHVAWREREGL